MTIAEQIYEKVKQLPETDQAEILSMVLSRKTPNGAGGRVSKEGLLGAAEPVPGLRGLWRDLAVEPMSNESIDEARREMWGGVPKDLPE